MQQYFLPKVDIKQKPETVSYLVAVSCKKAEGNVTLEKPLLLQEAASVSTAACTKEQRESKERSLCN